MAAPSLLIADCVRYDDAPGAPRVDVLVRDGRIARVAPARARPAGAAAADGAAACDAQPPVVLDAGGRTLAPGLIDVHIHGAGGADVQDGTPDALGTMAQTLARHGTTGFLATTVVRPDLGNAHLRAAAALAGDTPCVPGGARLLGLYLEGPFINPAKRGGLPAASITEYSDAALDEILAAAGGALRVMTVAPEMPGGLAAVRRLRAAGVLPAFGHSNATYDQARVGIDAGIGHVTHLYNAMPPLHHREPGPVLAILEDPSLTVELVADGVHVHERMVAWSYRLLGAARCACITDGMRTVGLPDGPYVFSGRAGHTKDGTARYDDGTLIGTSVPLAEIGHRFARFTGAPLRAVIDACARVPAAVLGLSDRKGAIAEEMDADLILLDDADDVWATVVAGEVVWRADQGVGGGRREARD